ncbi:hypothetical protein CENSYa_0119 [Cenarchaeum symbiosum A]|uniref:Uncharacterized protein n=1 Tax=Cenarchaeum symbiosum (strain A) TaxID=414004 RepID=A0RTU7_CENSY|nr:hypothetical protein CENSYa_0119 [Cenarchaeum symbiosum A]
MEKEFDSEALYNHIVHFYIDKKGCSVEKANTIAQSVIRREIERRMCKNGDCGHSMDDHIRNTGTCLIIECECRKFRGLT